MNANNEFDLAEALERFCLPDNVDDCVVNRGQAAVGLNVSETMLSRYIDQGMPVVSNGSNGQAYEIRLSEAYAWKMWREDQQRRRKLEGDQAAAQMRLLFRNDDEADPNDAFLSAEAIEAEADAQYKLARAGELRKELVRAQTVRDVFEELMVMFRNSIMTLPDYCEMNFGLAPTDVEKLQGRCAQVLVQARQTIEEHATLRKNKGEVASLRPEQEDMVG